VQPHYEDFATMVMHGVLLLVQESFCMPLSFVKETAGVEGGEAEWQGHAQTGAATL